MKLNKIYSIIFFWLIIAQPPCHAASFLTEMGSNFLASGVRNVISAAAVVLLYHKAKLYFQTPLEKKMEDLRQFCQGGLNDINTAFDNYKDQLDKLAASHEEILKILKDSNTDPNIIKKVEAEQEKTKTLIKNIQNSKNIIPKKVSAGGGFCGSCC
jgi:hypothetical protein